nr:16S rRNA (adenine(1518)-N(6)/adenine(1519)-N(6))-dimethyltransferase RsmA [Nitrosophilus alvini]
MEHKAKKQFGQNFLKDSAVLEKIIESMPKTKNKIVEIGPGLGDLTQKLLSQKDVIAFEIDRDLCAILKKKFEKEIEKKKLTLICEDALNHWKEKLIDEAYDLVANLPYYVATTIILRALKDPNCKNIVVMIQKEVAQKFAAKSGEREFSSLAVLAQSAGEAKILFDVGPESFEPKPKVTSAVLLIKKKRSLRDSMFEKFLKTAFKQPRKTLLKNLSAGYNKEILKNTFEKAGIEPTIRPHQATTSIYHRLYNFLEKRTIDGREKQSSAE